LWANAVYVKEANAIAVELKKKVCKITVNCIVRWHNFIAHSSFLTPLRAFDEVENYGWYLFKKPSMFVNWFCHICTLLDDNCTKL